MINATMSLMTTTPVVSNDTTAKHTIPTISKAMAQAIKVAHSGINEAVFKLERLETEREQWETTELAASRKRMYSLLTDCYEYYLTMKTDKSGLMREQYKKGLETFITVRQYTFLPTSHDMNKIVKSVFGVDRRRVSAYSLALRAALTAGAIDAKGNATPIPASDLATWLDEKGGVEEVRLGSKNKGMTPKERAEVAKTALKTSVLATLKIDSKACPFDTNDVDKMMVLVATYRPTGELEVSAVVRHDTAVRSALAAYYSGNKEEVAKAAEANSATEQTDSAIAIALEQQQ